MNKREFLKALAALPPEYKPTYVRDQLRYDLTTPLGDQLFCPLTAVANVRKPVSVEYYGSLNVRLASFTLDLDIGKARLVAGAADNPHWYDGLFKRRIRRIFEKQFERAYPNLGKAIDAI